MLGNGHVDTGLLFCLSNSCFFGGFQRVNTTARDDPNWDVFSFDEQNAIVRVNDNGEGSVLHGRALGF